jgi:hypothetical protein
MLAPNPHFLSRGRYGQHAWELVRTVGYSDSVPTRQPRQLTRIGQHDALGAALRAGDVHMIAAGLAAGWRWIRPGAADTDHVLIAAVRARLAIFRHHFNSVRSFPLSADAELRV